MKRLIILMLFFSLFLVVNAQIRDSFWGCKLGTTTKEQLVGKLRNYGFECKVDKKNNNLYIENVTFAGQTWETCSFEFYKNKLMLVGFGLESTKGDVVNIYDRISEKLKLKYPTVTIKTIVYETSHKILSFDDNKIIQAISYTINEEGAYSSLIYQSKSLITLMEKDSFEEL